MFVCQSYLIKAKGKVYFLFKTILVNVWQKSTQCCKPNSLQFRVFFLKLKKIK